MINNSQTQLFLKKTALGTQSTHPLLEIPLVRVIIEDFNPNWIDDPIKNEKTLNLIHDYLFVEKNTNNYDCNLEQILGEEIYTSLFGLKCLLANHKLKAIELGLEENKRQFKAFLNQELEA